MMEFIETEPLDEALRRDDTDARRTNSLDDPVDAPISEPRFRLVPFDKIELGSTVRYIVKGLVPREGLVVAWGPPKCGKSFWAFDLAMHVALGWEYRGRRVIQGPVVYVACEGAHGFRARIEAFRQHRLSEDASSVPFYLLPTAMNLVADVEALKSAIGLQVAEGKPVAVVLDTLNRSLAGSESSDEDMTAYLRASDAIREAFAAAVIIVHHCGTVGSRPRGHTALSGAVDAQLAIKKDNSGNFVVTVELMKDGPEGAEIVSRLKAVEVGTDDDGDPITSCIVEPVDGPPDKAGARIVSGQAKIALDLLERAIADAGEIPPASNHIPGGQNRVVPLSLWKRYCETGGLTEGDNAEAFKKAWKRVRERLLSGRFIVVWDNLVWLASSEGDKGKLGGQQGDTSPDTQGGRTGTPP